MSPCLQLLHRGRGAGIIHAKTAAQDLGWAIELRERSLGHRAHLSPIFRTPPAIERASMRALALTVRRDAALVHEILECERETLDYALWLQRIENRTPTPCSP